MKREKTLVPRAKWTLAAIMAAIIGVAVYYFTDPKFIGKNSNEADLVGGIDNFIGWAPGVAMNDGLAVNKDSRMYKEFGLALEINVIGDPASQIAALKSGDVDFIFTTTDIAPIMMDEGSDLVEIEAQEFLALVDSRGGDILVVDESITSVDKLKRKKVAVALGWPSNTMLDVILTAGGLTEKDIDVKNFASPSDVAKAYINGEADACVVWSPDNFQCLDARPSRELITTAQMPYTIVDVLVAKRSTLEKKADAFKKLARAWLTANAEVQNQGKYEWAAKAYKKAFADQSSINDLVDGLKGFRFMTAGDNQNYFSLNPEYTGTKGEDIYTRMTRAYKNGYGNELKNVTPWSKASNSSILEGLDLSGDLHAAEGTIKFSPAKAEEKTAEAVITKRVTVNFPVNSSILSPEEERTIRSAIGTIANQFSGMRIRVEGNTDSTGSRELNIRLSKERAQSVANFLVKEYGFDKERFIVVGNGPDKPVADNGTEAGRASNRRTDFEFVQ